MCSIISNWEHWFVGFFCSAIPMFIAVFWGNLKLFQPFSKLQKMGVEKIFINQSKAIQSIVEECKNTEKLRVFAVRGSTFSDKENSGIAKASLENANLKQFYLLSSPNNVHLKNRAIKLDVEDMYLNSLKQSISIIKKASQDHSTIKLLLHKEIVRFRIILLDNYLFLSFVEDKPTRQSEVLKIIKNSSLYKTYSELFDELWDKCNNQNE